MSILAKNSFAVKSLFTYPSLALFFSTRVSFYGMEESYSLSIVMTWKNLAPGLVRQRVIIEGTTEKIVEPQLITSYLYELSKVVGMRQLHPPFAYPAENMGYGGWIHWVTSGAHFYSYPTTPPLFTVDAYTCKPFLVMDAVEFTSRYLNAKDLAWKEVEV